MTSPAPYPAFDGTQACAGTDHAIWFPGMGKVTEGQRADVESYCAGCPFRRPCLAYALTNDVYGWWAGTTAADRHRIREEYGITAAPVDLGGAPLLTTSSNSPAPDTPEPRSPSQPASLREPSSGSELATGSSHDR